MKNMFALLMIAVVSMNGFAQTKQIRADKSLSSLTYAMKHALHAWTGTSREVACAAETDAGGRITRVAATVRVKSFDSQNSNRDAHMLEVTDALTYPNITFSSNTVTPETDGYLVRGNLSFHGVTKPFETKVTESKKNGRRIITGRFIFLLEDFGIERPTLMLVKTDNEVEVSFEFHF
ncbi:MAG: YceI family protein [bacterium]|jgi:polyisoprenoid-binding protein YceI|nr:YceI family protein [Chitinophagaceae bacterium]